MEKLIVTGGKKLEGTIELSGAKNAALPILVGSLFANDAVTLKNIPRDMEDIQVMLKIIEHIGAKVIGETCIDPTNIREWEIPEDLGAQTRASILMLGCLLVKLGKVKIPAPGGCKIGERKFDIHIDGLRALGAKIKVEEDIIEGEVVKFKGTNFRLRLPSTTGTENIVLAACFAEGHTTLENAHTRPEVLDFINFLNSMGAKISVPTNGCIEIDGVAKLHGSEYTVMGGEDEAITYVAAAGVMHGSIYIRHANISNIEYPVAAFRRAGLEISDTKDGIHVSGPDELKPTYIITAPYPGINSDLQPFFAVLATQAEGISRITDTRFTERFQYVHELKKMGARIEVDGNTSIVSGKSKLKGAKVEAMDLRAGGALVVAGLAAEGETELTNVYQIDRGYEHIEKKLSGLGADIKRIET